MYKVYWKDCEGIVGNLPFDSLEEAEDYAQMCHELGDTEIRIETGETI